MSRKVIAAPETVCPWGLLEVTRRLGAGEGTSCAMGTGLDWQVLFPTPPHPSTFFQMVKNLPAVQQTQVPSPILLPGESHGQRSLAGCGPWGRKESDTTE